MRKKGSTKNVLNNIKRKTNNVKKQIEGKSKSKKKRLIINIVLACIIFGIAIVSVFLTYVVVKAPKFDPNNLKFTEMTEIYDKDGNIIGKLGNENRTEVSYDDLPEVLIDAIIATEDSKFFQHNGFDVARFAKASLGQAVGKNSGGASTITMQIVKNNYTSTVSSGFEGIVRKFTDIYLSIFKVEKKYTKKEILELYVNDSYLGNGAYGVEQASKNYFGKSVSELNLAEASFIAGLFQSPTYYNPYNYPEKAEKRRQTVLYLMKRHGYITEEERQAASEQEISYFIKTVQVSNNNTVYQGYIDTVVEEMQSKYKINPYTTSLKIYTAMDKSKQDFINDVMNGVKWKWENDAVQAGIVMTTSQTGEIIAVGAGRNKNTELSFNYATQTNRQIGSTAKPIFAYGPAVEYLGYGTTNYIVDEPHTYSGGTKISNSDGGYRGILPMYQALGLSRNITALKAFQTVSKEAGNEKIVEFAQKLGLTPELSDGRAHEAHSIGAFTGSTKENESRNSPKTMAGAYGAFSNGGTYIEPHTVVKFIYKDNDEVHNPSIGEGSNFDIEKHTAMHDSTAWIITYALNWSATSGLARAAANIGGGVDIAAKTGTTNIKTELLRAKGISTSHVNDLWVCGYTPTQTLTFWYGYDKLTKEHYSTTATWKIRDRFYNNLARNLFDKTGDTFKMPSSIQAANVLKNSMPLKLAGENTPDSMKVVGYFRKGTVPTETSNKFSTLPSVTGLTSQVNGSTVTLSWKGLSNDQLLELNAEESYGVIGYDIYVKDGSSGSEKYLGTTTSTTFKDNTSYSNPIYVVYTAYKGYKDNRSKGVSHKVTLTTEFDVTASNQTINLGDTFTDNLPIIVLYNMVDVTEESDIQLISGSVDTSQIGTYELKYKVTYNGTSKTVTRTVTVE